jgi:hypothetical protein
MKKISLNPKVLLILASIIFITCLVLLIIPESISSVLVPVIYQNDDNLLFNQILIYFLLMSCSAFFIFLYIKKLKAFFFNVFLIVFILFIAELITYLNGAKRITWQPIDSAPYFCKSDTLGFALRKKENRIRSKCYYNDTIFLYDVNYTINKDGYRPTNLLNTEYNNDRSIVCLGCSFTFGVGLNDNETLPYLLQDSLKHKYNVYNMAVSGYAPNHILAQIEHNILDSIVRQKTDFYIYTTIFDHIRRIYNPDDYNSNIHSPKYIIDPETNQLKFKGHFDDPQNLKENKFFSKIKKSVLYNSIVNNSNIKENIELYTSLILKSKELLLKSNPNSQFHVIYWDLDNEKFDYSIVKSLQDKGIKVHLISHLIPDYIYQHQTYRVRYPYEFHPNFDANKKITEYILNKIVNTEGYFSKINTPFEEHFDSLNKSNWNIDDYSNDESGCRMIESQVKNKDSKIELVLEKNQSPEEKLFVGGGISSSQYKWHGKYEVSLKIDKTPGAITTINLINKWQYNLWEQKEIRIDFLGKNPNQVTIIIKNYKLNEGEPLIKQFNLGFNCSEDFHTYSIEWYKDSISFKVDERWIFGEDKITFNEEEMNIGIRHWMANEDNQKVIDWAGSLDRTKLPSTVYIDNVSFKPFE